MKPIHGQHDYRPKPEDAQSEPPIDCEFKVGDIVTYTNDYGVKFEGREISGFAPEITSWGGFVYLFKDAWWFPVPAKSLKLERRA